ncbi:MAG: 50S ribosomal protein L21 [Candidatus Ancillula sp.]|jgi:large subunit ribosomal protein L21|nr:50S ribosomal protein L21 [Candidatus Ancillula sp.]
MKDGRVKYAVVKVGGSQTKVKVDDIIVVNRLKGDKNVPLEAGAKVNLPVVLLVSEEGSGTSKVTLNQSDLEKVKVTAEVIRTERGKKISAMKFKNKTGYRKRWGHRQELTRLKIIKLG